MPATKEFRTYVAKDGRVLVLAHPTLTDGELLLSRDGICFYEQRVLGQARSLSDNGTPLVTYTFSNPHDRTSGKLHLLGDKIEFDNVDFIRHHSMFEMASVISLPLVDA